MTEIQQHLRTVKKSELQNKNADTGYLSVSIADPLPLVSHNAGQVTQRQRRVMQLQLRVQLRANGSDGGAPRPAQLDHNKARA